MAYPCFTARTFEYTIILLLFFSNDGFDVTQFEITEKIKKLTQTQEFKLTFTHYFHIPPDCQAFSSHKYDSLVANCMWKFSRILHGLLQSCISLASAKGAPRVQ